MYRTYGDYYFTAWGLILTLLGTFLAALKTVVTNLIQTGGGGRLKLVCACLLRVPGAGGLQQYGVEFRRAARGCMISRHRPSYTSWRAPEGGRT